MAVLNKHFNILNPINNHSHKLKVGDLRNELLHHLLTCLLPLKLQLLSILLHNYHAYSLFPTFSPPMKTPSFLYSISLQT